MAAAHRLAKALHVLGAILLGATVAVIPADSASRTLFGATGGAIRPIFGGAVEMVSYGLLFTMLFTFPCSVARGQVMIDLFTTRLTEHIMTSDRAYARFAQDAAARK